MKLADNPPKRFKLDEYEVAMLGKKRARQTVVINDEDAKQAGIMTTSTPQESLVVLVKEMQKHKTSWSSGTSGNLK